MIIRAPIGRTPNEHGKPKFIFVGTATSDYTMSTYESACALAYLLAEHTSVNFMSALFDHLENYLNVASISSDNHDSNKAQQIRDILREYAEKHRVDKEERYDDGGT